MPKPTVTFMCSECGGESLRWAGQCPHCRAWNTLQEFQVRKAPAGRGGRAQGGSSGRSQAAEPRGSRAVPLSEIDSEAAPRRPLAWGELNRVLGGGIVPGSIVLVGGEPGVGKSTLLMHAAQQIAAAGGTVLYASGEESPQQIRMRASRLGSLSAGNLPPAREGPPGFEQRRNPRAVTLSPRTRIQSHQETSKSGIHRASSRPSPAWVNWRSVANFARRTRRPCAVMR